MSDREPHVEFQSPPRVPGTTDDVVQHVTPGGFALMQILRRWRDLRRMRRES